MVGRSARGLARLARLRMGPFTMSVTLLGAASATSLHDKVVSVAWLLVLGLSAHVFGFVLNDLLDLEIDRASGRRTPLTTGSVSQLLAWAFCLVQLPLMGMIYALALPGGWDGSVVLIVSLALSAVYNRWSKSGAGRFVPFAAELALGAAISTLALAGTLAVSPTVPPAAYCTAAALGLVVHQLNSVPSGLKDLVSDRACGARSFVIAAGCRVSEGGQVSIPRWVKRYTDALLIAVFSTIVLLAVNVAAPLGIALISLVFVGAAFVYNRVLLSARTKEHLVRFPGRAMFFAFFAVPLVLIERLPIGLQMLFGLSAAYYLVFALKLTIEFVRGGAGRQEGGTE